MGSSGQKKLFESKQDDLCFVICVVNLLGMSNQIDSFTFNSCIVVFFQKCIVDFLSHFNQKKSHLKAKKDTKNVLRLLPFC